MKVIVSILCALLAIFSTRSVYSVEYEDKNKKIERGAVAGKLPPEVVLQNCKLYVDVLENKIKTLEQEISDPETPWRHYYYGEYMKQRANVQIEAFTWQNKASERLLWIVSAVVLSALLFSMVQLVRAVSVRIPDKIINQYKRDISQLENDDNSLSSSVEISAKQIRVTSSVVGIVVLVISLVFYYFFLTEVYHIELIDAATKSGL